MTYNLDQCHDFFVMVGAASAALTGIYLLEIRGALMLALGNTMGKYIAAVSLIVLLAYTVTGAWLLVVGVCNDRSKLQSKK